MKKRERCACFSSHTNATSCPCACHPFGVAHRKPETKREESRCSRCGETETAHIAAICALTPAKEPDAEPGVWATLRGEV